MKKVHVIGIDCQIDFGTKPNAIPGIKTGALYVQGGEEAMARAASLIRRAMPRIEDIHMTLDSHHRMHIANHTCWRDRKGNVPSPFTPVSADQIRSGDLRHVLAGTKIRYGGKEMTVHDYTLFYVEKLSTAGRYGLMLWPEHCLIATPGSALVPAVEEACSEYTRQHGGLIDYVPKGSNYLTEHYSAVKAEVPSPDDLQTTGLNTRLVETLEEAEEVWWLGIAGDYCVKNTFLDTIANFGQDAIERCVIVKDCIASISDDAFDAFCKDMTAKGVKVAYSKDL